MSNVAVYLKCNRNVEVQCQDVHLKDLGEIQCQDATVTAKLKSIRVHRFSVNGKNRTVISTLKLVRQMEECCPNISVEIIGETDVLVEWVMVDKYVGPAQWMKVLVVSLVCFFGTAFTIMAYHNDVGINEMFGDVYQMVMNREATGVNPLEVSYSIGLAAGIIVFFNHIGGRRITKDPTPIEVAMRNYEKDVDQTLIETAEREGKEEMS